MKLYKKMYVSFYIRDARLIRKFTKKTFPVLAFWDTDGTKYYSDVQASKGEKIVLETKLLRHLRLLECYLQYHKYSYISWTELNMKYLKRRKFHAKKKLLS